MRAFDLASKPFLHLACIAFLQELAGLAAPSGAGKDGKSCLGHSTCPHFRQSYNLTTPCMPKPEKQPKDFALQEGSDFKRAETKLREKHAAESGWKQDVSNRPLSRSDLAGYPTERRA